MQIAVKKVMAVAHLPPEHVRMEFLTLGRLLVTRDNFPMLENFLNYVWDNYIEGRVASILTWNVFDLGKHFSKSLYIIKSSIQESNWFGIYEIFHI